MSNLAYASSDYATYCIICKVGIISICKGYRVDKLRLSKLLGLCEGVLEKLKLQG
jgi:hypothetical protein